MFCVVKTAVMGAELTVMAHCLWDCTGALSVHK